MTPSPTEPHAAPRTREVRELVLLAADCVPRGSVVSYGDLAELVGCPARQVGRIMALHGSRTNWWRVVNHAGELPPHLLTEATARWATEGITVKPNGQGCRIARHRADLVALADAWEARCSAAQ